MERPTPSTVEQRWRELMGDPLLSMARLRERAIRGDLAVDQLRSLHWRIFLDQLPPPPAPTSPSALSNPSSWPIALAQYRAEWERCRDQFLRAPDGQLVVDGEGAGLLRVDSSGVGMSRSSSNGKRIEKEPTVVDLGVNNPLSDDAANPWKVWFRDLELRQTVRQDVSRTYPELEYFRRPAVQDQMTNILHVFAKLNEDIGYRQGMHELLGPLLHAVDHDSLEQPPPPASSPDPGVSLMYLTLSRVHIEHDTYTLFSALMRSAKADYDFNATVPMPIHSPTVPSRSSFGESPTLNGASVAVIGTKLVQPIIDKCCRIFDAHLRRTDFELWQHLEELSIEPQIWGIRWLRLLFTREFTLAEALRIWDAIFAQDPTLRLAEFVCLAMLLRAREALLEADYSAALQLLLRFPAPQDGDQKLLLLVRQAIHLQTNPAAEVGAEVRRQNQDLGAEVGEVSGARIGANANTVARNGRPAGARRHPDNRHSVASTSPAGSYLDDVNDLAKGVYDRAEAFGLPKAFNQAFAEFKRTYASGGGSGGGSGGVGMAMESSKAVHRQMTEELAGIKASNEAMAEALATCLDVLEDDVARPTGKVAGEAVDAGQVMALTALRHIQEVLSGKTDIFDGQVMAPILQRQRQKRRADAAAKSANGSRRGSAPTTSPSLPSVASADIIQPPAIAYTPHGGLRRGSTASSFSGGSARRTQHPSWAVHPPPAAAASSAIPAICQASSSPPTPPTKSPRMWQGANGWGGAMPPRPGGARMHDTGSTPSALESGAEEGEQGKPLPDPLGVLSA